MTALIVAVALTIGVSAFCSVLEAMILSTSSAEVEAMIRRIPKRGHLFKKMNDEIDDTISAILTIIPSQIPQGRPSSAPSQRISTAPAPSDLWLV